MRLLINHWSEPVQDQDNLCLRQPNPEKCFHFTPPWIRSLSWVHIASCFMSKLFFPMQGTPIQPCLTPLLRPLSSCTLLNSSELPPHSSLHPLCSFLTLVPFSPPLSPRESCLLPLPENNLLPTKVWLRLTFFHGFFVTNPH